MSHGNHINANTNQIRTLTLILDEPKMDFQQMDIKAITILVGANGTGKSFLMKTTWVLSYIACVLSQLRGLSQDQMIEIAQFIFDKSYEQPFTATGDLGCVFENDNSTSIGVHLDMGKINSVALAGFDDAVKFPIPKYLSSKLRLFDSISMYLKIRKDKVALGVKDEELVGAMLEYYPLYDVMYVEGLIQSSPIIIEEERSKILVDNYDVEDIITSLTVDLDKSDFYVTFSSGAIKYMKSYSAGHQVIINMIVGTGT